MTTKHDAERKAAKASAVAKNITAIAPHIEVLVGILDEWKLDLLLLAIGSGEVTIPDAE